MTNSEAGRSEDSGPETFSPAGYLLGLLQNIVKSGKPACIHYSGNVELIVLPGRKTYYSSVKDLEEVCSAPAASFRVETCDEAMALSRVGSVHGRLRELLWQAAFHSSQGRLVDGCSRFDVIKLPRWPNLTKLSVTPNTARICSLLTHHPCTIMLIPRVLKVEIGEINQIYSAAFCSDSVEILNRQVSEQKAEDDLPEVESRSAQGKGFLRTLFEKISGL